MAVTQLRGGETHPFGALRGFSALGGGEERLYRQIREAIEADAFPEFRRHFWDNWEEKDERPADLL